MNQAQRIVAALTNAHLIGLSDAAVAECVVSDVLAQWEDPGQVLLKNPENSPNIVVITQLGESTLDEPIILNPGCSLVAKSPAQQEEK